MTWSCKTPYVVYEQQGLLSRWDGGDDPAPRVGSRTMCVYEASKLLSSSQMKQLWSIRQPVTKDTPGFSSSWWRRFQDCVVEAWTAPKHMRLKFVCSDYEGNHHGIRWIDESDGTVYFIMSPEVFEAIEKKLVVGDILEADFMPVLRGGSYMGLRVV